MKSFKIDWTTVISTIIGGLITYLLVNTVLKGLLSKVTDKYEEIGE